MSESLYRTTCLWNTLNESLKEHFAAFLISISSLLIDCQCQRNDWLFHRTYFTFQICEGSWSWKYLKLKRAMLSWTYSQHESLRYNIYKQVELAVNSLFNAIQAYATYFADEWYKYLLAEKGPCFFLLDNFQIIRPNWSKNLGCKKASLAGLSDPLQLGLLPNEIILFPFFFLFFSLFFSFFDELLYRSLVYMDGFMKLTDRCKIEYTVPSISLETPWGTCCILKNPSCPHEISCISSVFELEKKEQKTRLQFLFSEILWKKIILIATHSVLNAPNSRTSNKERPATYDHNFLFLNPPDWSTE